MRLLNSAVAYFTNNSTLFSIFLSRNYLRCGYCADAGKKKDILFFDEKVQDLLRKLTGRDMQKIYSKRKDGKKLKTPEYKFMSDAELEEALKQAENRTVKKLQMPPVLPPRKEIDFVFTEDYKLKGFSNSKFVFTDITYGKNDRERIIVVREPDGTLRKANWEERGKMNEIYFPRPGRKLWIPTMFQADYLKDLLARKEYLFILDSACLQFEPDDPEYIRITETTYAHINEERDFNILRSTRHYGPLMFYLGLNLNIDNLLVENLETDRLEEAIWAIDLFNILNPDNRCHYSFVKGEELHYIKAFIDTCSVQKGKVELVFNKYKDILRSPKVSEVF